MPIPSEAVLGQNVPLAFLLGMVGLTGMLLSRRNLASAASLTLLILLVWGKIAGNILKTSSPDTAVLLVEFSTVLLLLEASGVLLVFNRENSLLAARADEFSERLQAHLHSWLQNQLLNQAKTVLAVVGLSMVLIPVAGLTGIASGQIVFSATLALLAIVILLFLVTHRREPKN